MAGGEKKRKRGDSIMETFIVPQGTFRSHPHPLQKCHVLKFSSLPKRRGNLSTCARLYVSKNVYMFCPAGGVAAVALSLSLSDEAAQLSSPKKQYSSHHQRRNSHAIVKSGRRRTEEKRAASQSAVSGAPCQNHKLLNTHTHHRLLGFQNDVVGSNNNSSSNSPLPTMAPQPALDDD